MHETINIHQTLFNGFSIATEHASILIIQGKKANLGCGYLNCTTANRLNDRFCIVSNVKNFEDMLMAKVVEASNTALECGVVPGVTSGEDALLLMENK